MNTDYGELCICFSYCSINRDVNKTELLIILIAKAGTIVNILFR